MPGSVAGESGLRRWPPDMDITLGGMDAGLMKKWGVTTADGMQTRFAGSTGTMRPATPYPLKSTRVRFTERIQFGKTGDDTSHKYT